jgi:uncharacterized membrane protein
VPPDHEHHDDKHGHAGHGDAGHGHGPFPKIQVSRRLNRLLAALLTPLVLGTLIGLVALWPRTADDNPNGLIAPGSNRGELISATVVDKDIAPCDLAREEVDDDCLKMTVRLTEGPRKGERVDYLTSLVTAGGPLAIGANIIVERIEPTGYPAFYAFYDYQRQMPILLLVGIFVAFTLFIGRTRGLRALFALVVSLVILTVFTLPAIINGSSPLIVALVSASAIMLVALYISHGWNPRTTSAVIGTLTSLVITGFLAVIFTNAAQLSGLLDDDTSYLRASLDGVDLRGILLAGTIIGALGVLDDVTVTQASAVWEIHLADPKLSARQLYTRALRIGQDHISSVVNTLLLAYAGASLPLLLLFSQSGEKWTTIATGELVATEIVRTLVGSVGLMCSVPITTFLTALVVAGGVRREPTRKPVSRKVR